MTQLSATVVKTLLLGHTLVDEDAYHDGWDYWSSAARDKWERETVEVEGLGTVEVFYEGSRPSDYEDYYGRPWRALIFKIGDRLFKQEGEYASHGGANHWEGAFIEVEASDETVSRYVKVKTVDDLTASEVETLLEEYAEDEGGWAYWDYEVGTGETLEVVGLGDVTIVHKEGKHKWESDLVIVVKLENGRHFEKKGYYASYEGSTWDGPFTEVTPTTEVITVFKPKAAA